MDRFLLAENPINPEGGCAIIHTIEPIAIIECMQGHITLPAGIWHNHYIFVNSNDLTEPWTLRVHHIFTREMDAEQHSAIINKLFDKAWRWYRAYMEWEDKQIDEMP